MTLRMITEPSQPSLNLILLFQLRQCVIRMRYTILLEGHQILTLRIFLHLAQVIRPAPELCCWTGYPVFPWSFSVWTCTIISDTKAWSLEESSINGTGAIYRNWWDRLNFLGPQGSMPMTSDIPSSSTIVPSNKVILEAMARCLLSVTVADTAS